MKLVHKIKTYFVVNYSDLEQFIIDEFGHDDYSFVADMECSNDSEQIIYVREGKLEDYYREDVAVFKKTGKHSFLTQALTQYLYEQGKVQAGEYLIRVSW